MARSRIALAAAFAGVVLSSWTAFGQEPAAPQTTGDAWFVYSRDGKARGYFHIVKKASGEEAAPVLLVHDMVTNETGKQKSLHMQTFCKDDAYFSPVRIVCGGEGRSATNMNARIERPAGGPSAGKFKGTVDDREVEIDIPEHTVIDFALFEIARTLPFDKDKVFEFNWTRAIGFKRPRPNRGHKVAYAGREELEIEGKKQTLHKFEQTGKGIQPTYYWVNDDHQLVRVLWDGRRDEFVLTTKEKATAALKAG